MAQPIVAIVGRPNVGKSTLFNKLVGSRVAIVEDTPGVTRDRIYGDVEWLGRAFTLIDTGGIEPYSGEEMWSKMRAQAQVAIDTADCIVMVTDVTAGVTANDLDVAQMLQKSQKPIVLCVNKCDNVGATQPEVYEFYNLGLGDPYPVSSIHGHGTGDLLDVVLEHLPEDDDSDPHDGVVKVAVIGKPNVGKSSLVNFLAGEERVIVSPIAGTTRDAVDTLIERDGKPYLFIDTAGIRRKSRVNEQIEKFSVMRAHMAVDRADVCVIMIDATEGFTEQDSKIAGYAHEQGKASIIAVNKWDAVHKDGKTMRNMEKDLETDFAFMSYAPFVFFSALTGDKVDNLFPLIDKVHEKNTMRVPTGKLNEVLATAMARLQPPTDRGKRLRIYYMTQASTAPPTFVVFVNRKDLFHFSYERYLENRIRETFELTGTPVRFVIRERTREK